MEEGGVPSGLAEGKTGEVGFAVWGIDVDEEKASAIENLDTTFGY